MKTYQTMLMKTCQTMLTFVVLLATGSATWALPKIKVLATGGTIAGAQATQADAGYKSGTFSVDDLIKAVPQLKNIAEMSGEQVANIGSQTMNHEVWLKLAARVNLALICTSTAPIFSSSATPSGTLVNMQ